LQPGDGVRLRGSGWEFGNRERYGCRGEVGGDVVYVGKRRKKPSIVAMHKNAKVEGGVPENQVAEHE